MRNTLTLNLIALLLSITAARAQTSVEFGAKKPVDAGTAPKSAKPDDTHAVSLLFQALAPPKAPGDIGGPHFGSFSVKTCGIPLAKWLQYVVGAEITHTFAFKEGCDLDGTVHLAHKPFPIDLAIRHLDDFNRVKVTMKIDLNLDINSQQALTKIAGTDGQLLTATTPPTEFTGHYQVGIGLDGKLVGNPGGTMHITKLRGKDADIDSPLLFE